MNEITLPAIFCSAVLDTGEAMPHAFEILRRGSRTWKIGATKEGARYLFSVAQELSEKGDTQRLRSSSERAILRLYGFKFLEDSYSLGLVRSNLSALSYLKDTVDKLSSVPSEKRAVAFVVDSVATAVLQALGGDVAPLTTLRENLTKNLLSQE